MSFRAWLTVGSFLFVCVVVDTVFVSSAQAQEGKWYPYVIARGDDRDCIKSLPIEARPNRPLHFYGNSVRRNVQRGNPLPLPRDLIKTTAVLIRRR